MQWGRSMKERREVFVRRLVFSLLVMAGCAFTQEFRGTLSGRVTDPSGAGVPSAKIAVIQTETNARSQTVSGPDGSYTVPFLAPGVYQVEAEAGGFSKYIRSGVRVFAV